MLLSLYFKMIFNYQVNTLLTSVTQHIDNKLSKLNKFYIVIQQFIYVDLNTLKSKIKQICIFIKLLVYYLIDKYYYKHNIFYFVLKSHTNINIFKFFITLFQLKNTFSFKNHKPTAVELRISRYLQRILYILAVVTLTWLWLLKELFSPTISTPLPELVEDELDEVFY